MMRKYQVRFGGGPTEKAWSTGTLAGGLPYYSHSRSSFVRTCAKRYVTSHQQREAGTARDVAVTWPAVGTDLGQQITS